VVVQSNFYGKLATVLFYVAITALVFAFPYAKYFLLIAIVSTIIAFLQYAFMSFKGKQDSKGQEGRNEKPDSNERQDVGKMEDIIEERGTAEKREAAGKRD
jgi:membrane protein implicated in regulation of membrane protease activity